MYNAQITLLYLFLFFVSWINYISNTWKHAIILTEHHFKSCQGGVISITIADVRRVLLDRSRGNRFVYLLLSAHNNNNNTQRTGAEYEHFFHNSILLYYLKYMHCMTAKGLLMPKTFNKRRTQTKYVNWSNTQLMLAFHA